MTPGLAQQIIRSLEAMKRQAQIVSDRYASDPSALGKGTRRAMHELGNGMDEVKRAIEKEVSLVVSGAIEVNAAESAALDRLTELLPDLAASWSDVAERLAREGFDDGNGRAFRRERLILLAIAAASGRRYALGSRAGETGGGRLFDLFNLPREVGGAGGLAPIVRACYTGATRYAMTWRFASQADCSTAAVVDDDADLTPESPDA